MALAIGVRKLSVHDVVEVARHKKKVRVSENALKKVRSCRKMIEKKIKERAIIYGVTTGIGELAEVVLTPDQFQEFQTYLVYSHTAGYGDPIAVDDVRAAMLSRINVLAKGFSGMRPVVLETLTAMLNKGVTPVVCQRGSVGACGDLSPMGQIAIVLIGEGEAFYRGKRMTGKDAMAKAGIPTIKFEARDGLATINGSNVTAGMGALQIYDAERFLKSAQIASAVSLDALNGNTVAFDERIHKIRGYPGAVTCAANIRRIVEGGGFIKAKGKKVQDAYSLRSTPQVIGAAIDTLEFSRRMFLTELNGVGDNPIFFEENGGTVLTGANFQGTPLGFGLEFLGTALTTVAVLSERRLNRLMNPSLSMGLPPFLTEGAGMFSGLMLTQYTAGALVCECRVLCNPAATGSVPAAADQEDFVSMSMTSAIKTKQILSHICAVVAIELIAGAQALEFRKPLKPGKGVQAAFEAVRQHVKPLKKDRPLPDDINRMAAAVAAGEIVSAVEDAIGPLE
jgi:histidine ammonia-lyase